MSQQRTLCIIKPDAIRARKQGAILQQILDAEIDILAMRQLRLTRSMAEAFYAVHKERPFFDELVDFMISGTVVVAALRAQNAVSRYRELIGATDPAKAAPGTIRQLYGTNIENNAVHGSDSADNGLLETSFFFAAYLLTPDT
jgi:nucleoside-diphosphate kinase